MEKRCLLNWDGNPCLRGRKHRRLHHDRLELGRLCFLFWIHTGDHFHISVLYWTFEDVVHYICNYTVDFFLEVF